MAERTRDGLEAATSRADASCEAAMFAHLNATAAVLLLAADAFSAAVKSYDGAALSLRNEEMVKMIAGRSAAIARLSERTARQSAPKPTPSPDTKGANRGR